MRNTRRILRQVRRNNIAVVWNNFEEQIQLVDVPKRLRKAWYRLRRNQRDMQNAVKFMQNPSLNPQTGLPLKKRAGKKLFSESS